MHMIILCAHNYVYASKLFNQIYTNRNVLSILARDRNHSIIHLYKTKLSTSAFLQSNSYI